MNVQGQPEYVVEYRILYTIIHALIGSYAILRSRSTIMLATPCVQDIILKSVFFFDFPLF